VRAFVRDTTKIPEDLRNKVEAVVGDVTNAKEVANAVAGRDAVIVVLGTREDLSKHIFSNIYTSFIVDNDMLYFILCYFKALLLYCLKV